MKSANVRQYCQLIFIHDDFISRFTRDKQIRGILVSQASLFKINFVITKYDKNWFAARNVCNNKALANPAKISRTQTKVVSCN